MNNYPKLINAWSRLNNDKDETVSEAMDLFTSYGGFGSEFLFGVDRFGNWVFRVFNHENTDNAVEFVIHKDGKVTVERTQRHEGIRDTRKVTF